MNFGNWDSALHKRPEQVSRISAGQKILKSNIQLLSNGSAKVIGSGAEPYTVTLDSCTCSDFSFRSLPCKHIYAFAIAIGAIVDLPIYNFESTSLFDVEKEIERFYALYSKGVITGEQYYDLSIVLMRNKDKSKITTKAIKKEVVSSTVNPKYNIGPFTGMSFVLTGSLVNYNRDEAMLLIEASGGSISSAVTKQTSIVIAGDNAGSKLTKAYELGITVITENEFTNMLSQLK